MIEVIGVILNLVVLLSLMTILHFNTKLKRINFALQSRLSRLEMLWLYNQEQNKTPPN